MVGINSNPMGAHVDRIILTAIVSVVLGAVGGGSAVTYYPKYKPHGLDAETRAFVSGMAAARIAAMQGSLNISREEIQGMIFQAGLTSKDLHHKQEHLWKIGIVTVDMLKK